MIKIKSLEKTVKSILMTCPESRGDDDLLYIKVLDANGINIYGYDARNFILSYRKKGLPTIETVGRCRRKLQEKKRKIKARCNSKNKQKNLREHFLRIFKKLVLTKNINSVKM